MALKTLDFLELYADQAAELIRFPRDHQLLHVGFGGGLCAGHGAEAHHRHLPSKAHGCSSNEKTVLDRCYMQHHEARAAGTRRAPFKDTAAAERHTEAGANEAEQAQAVRANLDLRK